MPKGARQPISLRLRPGLRDRVRGQADREGKTLNEMVNDLLEQALADNQPVELAFGSRNGFKVAQALISAAEAAVVCEGGDQGLWLWDHATFDKAAGAIQRTLEVLRPSEARETLAELKPPRSA